MLKNKQLTQSEERMANLEAAQAMCSFISFDLKRYTLTKQ